MKIYLSGLPKISKKAGILLAVFGFILVAGTLRYFFSSQGRERAPGRVAALVLQEHAKGLQGDADNDGLKDWEETIFRTDKNNPDSDKDGIKDGDEIAQGKDPTVPGPDDAIIPAQAPTEKIEEKENITRDFTENFLREPIGQILAGQSTTVNPEYVEAYTQRLLQRSLLAAAPRVSVPDIRVIEKPTGQEIVLYFNSFKKIFDTLEAKDESEVDIVVRAFKDQDYGELKKIDERVHAYRAALDGLMSLLAPRMAVEFHVTVINYVHRFSRAAEIMRNAETDPIQAMLVINELTKLREEFGAYLAGAEKTLIASISK